MRLTNSAIGIGLATVLATTALAQPLGTAFTYQGQLKESGDPAGGTYDLRFQLFNVAVGGAAVGTDCVEGVAPVDGLFTVELDFGASPFDGDSRWLEIAVRSDATPANCTNTSGYTTLTTRQPLTAVPYALFALDGPGSPGFWAANGTHIQNTNSGRVGIGALPNAKLGIYEPGESTVQTTFTQALGNAGVNIACDYTANAFTPGVFWSTQNNNATKPKAGIYMHESSSGSRLHFGTSDTYATGITNDALVIDPDGNVGVGTASPQSQVHVTGPTAALRLDANDDASSYFLIDDRQATQVRLTKQTSASSSIIDIDPMPLDGVSNATMRFFRHTNTAGPKGVAFHRGNDTTAVSAVITVDGYDSWFQAHGGNFGIGTSAPAVKLDVQDHDAIARLTAINNSDGPKLQLKNNVSGVDGVYGAVEFLDGSNTLRSYVSYADQTFGPNTLSLVTWNGVAGMTDDGNFGIGLLNPQAKLHVAPQFLNTTPSALWEEDLLIEATDAVLGLYSSPAGLRGSTIVLGEVNNGALVDKWAIGRNTSSDGTLYFKYGNQQAYDANPTRMVLSAAGNLGIGTSSPAARLDVNGTARVSVLEITGADVAEKFPTSGERNAIKPGMVMEIDPHNAGKLRIARGDYNRRVAGVVSGAGDIPTGTILGNLPGCEDAPPIALSGRIYVQCDATHQAIEPGDMLTTSAIDGHAMKVTDFPRAQGAIIGKAMSALPQGQSGLVLVLVNLQ